jgi:predicted outer membrane repeat protein
MLKKLPRPILVKKAMIIAVLSLGAFNNVQAQTITLYRTGTIVPPTFSKVADAISAAMAGDSLVMSPHVFKENSLVINKNLKLTGTSDSIGMTTIDAESKGRVLLITDGMVALKSIIFTKGKIVDAAGGAICNYGTRPLVISGNSKITNSSCSGIFANGGGVYSAGRVDFTDNVEVSNNYSTDQGGGVYAYSTFVLSGNAVIKNNKTDGSGGGVFAQANGACLVTDYGQIINNEAKVAGGGLFGVGTIQRHASISNNIAELGGGIASYSDILFLRDTAMISNNTATGAGGGIWLNNCLLYGYDRFHIINNKIPASSSTTNFGGAIYNVNGSMYVTGGVIKGNQSPVAAVYNTAGTAATIVRFNSTHFYNPMTDGTRQPEIFNSPSLPSSIINFTSNYCWWGSNDTTDLIANRPGTNSGVITSYVVSNWLLNLGNPVDPMSNTFPLSVDFRLDDGSKMDSLTLRHLKAMFTASKGSFSPASASVDTNNYIRTTYSAPAATDSITITAWVDADTFMTEKIAVKGLSIAENKTANTIKVYPNPATETIYISNAPIGTKLTIYDLSGKIANQYSIHNNIEAISINSLPTGTYIMQFIQTSGQRASVQFIKQ